MVDAPVRVGINGYNRDASMFFRSAMDDILDEKIKIVGINDKLEPLELGYILKFVNFRDENGKHFPYNIIPYGKFVYEENVYNYNHGWIRQTGETRIEISDNDTRDVTIKTFNWKTPKELDWGWVRGDIILDFSSEHGKLKDLYSHLDAGAKYVIKGSPSQYHDEVPNVVIGTNHVKIDFTEFQIIASSSHLTNAIAPLISMFDSNYVVKEVNVDIEPSYNEYSSLERACLPANNIKILTTDRKYPSSAWDISELEQLMPWIEYTMKPKRILVPLGNGIKITLEFELSEKISREQVNKRIIDACSEILNGIFKTNIYKMGRHSVFNSPLSGTIPLRMTYSDKGSNKIRIVSYSDIETGYANRLMDLVYLIGMHLNKAGDYSTLQQ